ncbi:MAG: 1-acyl-sn-glycerol-3-phosphate acyltransferase [Cyclobacteriaceae bacterium]|nr:1-acyl-sn-glycerol-3-phosphate acyltransferase [Cyclobacteriaceae bacterium]
MKILKGLYTAYCLVVFTFFFLILFPSFLVPIFFPKKFKLVGVLNRWWGRLVFTCIGLPYVIEYKSKLDPKKQYIFCPNHFSYLDIASLVFNEHDAIFVGKSDMESIPLFGYMYRKLHITVDRTNLKSRYSTMVKSLKALDEGKSLVIFPEGGIITERDPVMARFKDGAFRASIEKQISIVPVTIPYNWIILPPYEFLITWRKMKVIFHEPIEPIGMTMNDIEVLKTRTKETIEAELAKQLTHEN